MADNQTDAALAVLRQGLAKLPNQIDLLWNLAHLLAQQSRPDEAAGLIARLEKRGFPRAELDYLRARLLVSDEKWREAVRRLERTYPLLLGNTSHKQDWFAVNLAQECDLLTAWCYEHLDDADAAGAAYNRVVARNPRSIPGRLGLARTEWHLDRLDAALKEYQQLMQLPNAPAAAWVEAASVLISRNLKSKRPDWAAVERILAQAETLRPVPVEVKLLRAEMLADQSKFAEARAALAGEAGTTDNRPLDVWVGLANLEQRQGRSDAALAILDDAQRQLGDRLELRLARCRIWSVRGGAAAVRALDELGRDVGKFKSDGEPRLLRALAAAYLQVGETARAASLWQRVADRQKNNLGSRLALFDLALRDADADRMAALVGEIRSIEEDQGPLWRYCEACRLLSLARPNADRALVGRASDLLGAVADKRPRWARVPLAQAQAAEILGNPELAIAKYRQAVLLGERRPAVVKRAADLLASRGRVLEAEEMIERLRDQGTPLGELGRTEVEIALRKQDTGLALQLAEKAIKTDTKDYRDRVWLGQIQWAAGKRTEAEASFRAAVRMAPAAPDAWTALVLYLVRVGEKAKAEAAVGQAELALPRDQAAVPLAQCYEAVGNVAKARSLYEAARSSRPSDAQVLQNLAYFHLRQNENREARKCLEEMIGQRGVPPAQVAAAKRALALVLASANDYQQTVRALEVLGVVGGADQLGPMAETNYADQRAKIVILARAQNPRQRRQAIGLLEGLVRNQQATQDERYLLGQLYESVGDWAKAREQFLFVVNATAEALRNRAGDPALQKRYADQVASLCASLLRRDHLGEAEAWLAKLEEAEPDGIRSVGLRAQLLGKRNQSGQAVPELLALARDDEKLTGPVATLLEKIKQPKAAEEMYRKFVAQSKKPEAVLTLAAFLGRQDRADEALTLCEAALKTCRPDRVAEVAVLVLYTSKFTDGQCRRVAGWLQELIEKNPTSVALPTHLAAVRRLQKDYPGVITIYRRALERDANDTLTMNNLAWLQALSERNGGAALKTIQRAIELDGPQAELLDTRAVAYLTLGDARRAIQDLEEAIAETPTAHRYFHLAQAHWLAGDRASAFNAYDRGKRIGLTEATVDPLEVAAYRQLGAALEPTAAR
jgi:tetratricopeptide (TPR) repeat protein